MELVQLSSNEQLAVATSLKAASACCSVVWKQRALTFRLKPDHYVMLLYHGSVKRDCMLECFTFDPKIHSLAIVLDVDHVTRIFVSTDMQRDWKIKSLIRQVEDSIWSFQEIIFNPKTAEVRSGSSAYLQLPGSCVEFMDTCKN